MPNVRVKEDPASQALRGRAIKACTVVALAALSGSCTSNSSCDPDQFGLGSAPRLVVRSLYQGTSRPVACDRPRLDVLATQKELADLYTELGIASQLADAGVDFERERVVVREGDAAYGISWGVATGETGVFGLLSCRTPSTAPTCVPSVVAVSARIVRAETRTCDPVGCGAPQTTTR